PKVRHWKCRVGVKPHRGFESRPLRFFLRLLDLRLSGFKMPHLGPLRGQRPALNCTVFLVDPLSPSPSIQRSVAESMVRPPKSQLALAFLSSGGGAIRHTVKEGASKTHRSLPCAMLRRSVMARKSCRTGVNIKLFFVEPRPELRPYVESLWVFEN